MAEYYRCYKEIDLDIIEKNFDALKSLTKDGVKAMAVVKADAYGHGAVQVAETKHNLAGQRLLSQSDSLTIQALLLLGCVTSSKLLNLSGPRWLRIKS